MLRLISAEWLRMRRLRLTWILGALLLVILALQVRGMLTELEELTTEVETGLSLFDDSPLSPEQIQGNRYLIEVRRTDLQFPAFIGTVARLSTGFGWFFVILLTVVFGGEDFSRRILPGILARGVRRSHYLIARTLALWLAMGAAVMILLLLAAAAGPWVHQQVTDDPISLAGSGEALLWSLRSWIACLPFIVAVLFWTVLARNMGPALGVGIGLHSLEFLHGLVLPFLSMVFVNADSSGVAVPLIYRLQMRLYGLSIGFNADVFLNWGAPYLRDTTFVETNVGIGLNQETFLSNSPGRALAFMAGYVVVFFACTMWILRKRDVTYGP
jgi:ABC-type transport system involved in multi-copper enzyme maturation permease subunit